jgi:hypothetical protein
MYINYKKAFLCLMLFCFESAYSEQLSWSNDKDLVELNERITRDDSGCSKICTKKLIAKCAKVYSFLAHDIDATNLNTDALCARIINADSICTRTANINGALCASTLRSPIICSEQISATSMCASNLIANKFQQCGLYRATAVLSSDQLYTLGTLIPIDTSLDDPNADVSFAPFSYTVPISGYYILTVQIDQHGISGVDPILGTPLANLEVLVNGITNKETFTPYLSFHNGQKVTVSSLISLNAGDVVQLRYNVYVMNDGSGFMPYVGTIILEGDGTAINGSIFKIHYLSSDCTTPTACECPLPPCNPTPCNYPCVPQAPCVGMSCSNCTR